jgi:hypothetical protein
MPSQVCRTHCPKGSDGMWWLIVAAVAVLAVLGAATARAVSPFFAWLGHWWPAIVIGVFWVPLTGALAVSHAKTLRRGRISDDPGAAGNAAAGVSERHYAAVRWQR